MSTIWADLESKRSQEANLKKKKEAHFMKK